MRSDPHEHQERAIEMLRDSLRAGHRRPMLQAPTGFGKTICAARMIEGALAKGKRAVFTAPTISLIDQTVSRLFDEGIEDVGVIQSDHPMSCPWKPVQVASIQTLQNREKPDADLVIIDEAHRDFKFTREWMADPDWSNIPFIGLSTTPWTKGLGKFYDDLLIPTTTGDLIQKGYLADFRVFAPSHPDLSGVSKSAGDYHQGELGEAMNEDKLVADIVSTWIAHGHGLPTLVFAVDRAHARSLQERFASSGISTGYVDDRVSGVDRAEIGRRFNRGDIEVVVNVGCLTTGVDWDVRCIVLARPTHSAMLHVQIIGRGLRTAPGKTDCLILDHADNHARLGFVTDINPRHMDDGVKREATAPEKPRAAPKECSQCAFLRPPGMRSCAVSRVVV